MMIGGCRSCCFVDAYHIRWVQLHCRKMIWFDTTTIGDPHVSLANPGGQCSWESVRISLGRNRPK
jgi:hypothetical protein